MNVNSLVNKVLYLKHLIGEYDLSAIAVCETWSVPSVSSSFVSVDGFRVVRRMALYLLESMVAIELSDVIKIGDKQLYRAKVLNTEKRSELLIVTGRLRTMSGFENLYIQKDFTFRQKQELSERRRKAIMNTVDVDGGESSRSDGGVAVAGSFGMNGHVSIGRGRRCCRGQVSSKLDRTVYGSTPHVARKSLN